MLPSHRCVCYKSFSFVVFHGTLCSVFRLLLWAVSHSNPCYISVPVEMNAGCCRILAWNGDVLGGFFPFSASASILLYLVIESAAVAQGSFLRALNWTWLSRFLPIELQQLLVSDSKCILCFKEMHLDGWNGFADCPVSSGSYHSAALLCHRNKVLQRGSSATSSDWVPWELKAAACSHWGLPMNCQFLPANVARASHLAYL